MAARLPDDFDPFAEAAAPAPSAGNAPAVSGSSPFQEVLGAAASGPSLDTVFDLKGGAASSQADPLAAFLAPPAKADAASSSVDPFAFLSADGALAAPVGPAAPDHTPDLQAAYRPPPVRPASPSPAPTPTPKPTPAPAPAPVAAPATADAPHGDALWDAFCDGAQLTLLARARLTPELMRLLGATLRHAVEGTVQLSAARTTVKQELHVPVTVIKPKGNNPLKFAPDAAAALAQMLQPPMRGFMAAPEAMQDAMTDLLGHSVGTMEGTRAALQGMLQRFEPSQLEAQLADGGMLDKLLPANRRARLWELYLQHYGRISEAAREDFDELFGKAFVKAYEAHADRVAAARRGAR
jgi:FHA domain-containing protein